MRGDASQLHFCKEIHEAVQADAQTFLSHPSRISGRKSRALHTLEEWNVISSCNLGEESRCSIARKTTVSWHAVGKRGNYGAQSEASGLSQVNVPQKQKTNRQSCLYFKLCYDRLSSCCPLVERPRPPCPHFRVWNCAGYSLENAFLPWL